MSVSPSIYIACLASYNAGILHGKWVDLETEDPQEGINEVLETSPIEDAEEYAVHDHEYCGNLSEYAGLSDLTNIKEAFGKASNEGIDWEVFVGYCEHLGEELEPDKIEGFQDAHAGSAQTFVDWCHQYIDDTGMLDPIPENLRTYFNVEAFARDMEINNVFTIEHDSEVHVFYHM